MNSTATTGPAQTLTLADLERTMRELEHLLPRRDTSRDFFGIRMHVAPEFPKVKLNYKCRTKYGDEFDLLTKEQQRATDAWLLATFGTTCAIPEGTAYMLSSMFGQGLHINPRDAVKLTGIV